MYTIETLELPDVAPESPLGQAHARYLELELRARVLQQELATLRGEHEEERRAFLLAVYRDRRSDGLMRSLAERDERINALGALVGQILDDRRTAERRFHELFGQYVQLHTALPALRQLAG